MKIVRKITYELPDDHPNKEQRLRQQIQKSLPEGTHCLSTNITIEHLEGPRLEELVKEEPDGTRSA